MSTDADADADDVAEQLREALRFLAHDAREGHSSTLALLDLRRVNAESALPGELVLRIERNALRSLSRIDDFVALARARSQPLNAEELDLLDLLFDAVAEAWQVCEERGVRLKVIDPPEEAVLRADRSLLRSAIGRLLRHGVDRAGRGSQLLCSVRGLPHAWSIEVDEAPDSAAVPPALRTPAPAPTPADSQHGWAMVKVVAHRMGGSAVQRIESMQGVHLRVTLPRA